VAVLALLDAEKRPEEVIPVAGDHRVGPFLHAVESLVEEERSSENELGPRRE
jgi:hypothetical protein